MFTPYNNPYYIQPQMNRMNQYIPPQPSPAYNPQSGLQGKSVDSLEVVKAMDIPLDR